MPAVILAKGATTGTTQSFTITNLAADGTLELQISTETDFQFCVCPIYPGLPRASPYVANGLNQDARYFARCRSRRASGAAEDWSNIVAFKTPLVTPRSLTVPAIVREPAIIMRPEPVISWTAGNEVAGFPAKNVSRDAPVAWRSIAAGGVHRITLEHSGAPIDTIPILGTNLPEAATMGIVAGNTLNEVVVGPAPYASAVQLFRASANMPGRSGYHGLILLPAPIEYPFIQVFLTPVAAMPANMIHVEHVLIGLNRKTRNMALDDNESPINRGSKDRTRTGNPDKVEGVKMRRVEFDISYMTETQSETQYQEVMSWLDEAVFVLPNSKAGPFLHDRMLYGDLKGHRRTGPSSIHHTRTFIVESLI